MKKVLLVASVLALSFSAQANLEKPTGETGRVTIVFTPTTANGDVVETDLRQEGNQILGNSSIMDGIINLTIADGKYEGPTGHSLTSLKCTSVECDGFINGVGVNLSNKTMMDDHSMSTVETSGTVNSSIYSSSYNGEMLTISAWNSLDLKKSGEGKYMGQAAIGNGLYDVSVLEEGSMSNFLADPALVAIFLGAPIAGH
jgi:hypothetical protein